MAATMKKTRIWMNMKNGTRKQAGKKTQTRTQTRIQSAEGLRDKAGQRNSRAQEKVK
jgi:hypothetical protein